MKKLLSSVLLLLLASLSIADAQHAGRGGQGRQHRDLFEGGSVYATADDGTPLKWRVFPAAVPGPHPAVLIIHGGGFRSEPFSPNMLRAAREAAAMGCNAFLVQYRLAFPNRLPGQVTPGCFPDQTNDLKKAVRAARQYPGGNGKVGAIGGSAGASHAVYLAATGTKGDDRLDAVVALSGAYDFVELTSHPDPLFKRVTRNYVCSFSIEAKRKASPVNYIDATVSPLFLIASDNELMPPEQLTGLVAKLKEAGATNYKQLVRPNSQRHSFSYWPDVSEPALEFLKQHLGPTG
jgi:acetyl esterase/lipase